MNPNSPPHWLAYFKVSDCDGTVEKAGKLDAGIYQPAMTIEKQLRTAVLADSQGAAFAIFQALPHE